MASDSVFEWRVKSYVGKNGVLERTVRVTFDESYVRLNARGIDFRRLVMANLGRIAEQFLARRTLHVFCARRDTPTRTQE